MVVRWLVLANACDHVLHARLAAGNASASGSALIACLLACVRAGLTTGLVRIQWKMTWSEEPQKGGKPAAGVGRGGGASEEHGGGGGGGGIATVCVDGRRSSGLAICALLHQSGGIGHSRAYAMGPAPLRTPCTRLATAAAAAAAAAKPIHPPDSRMYVIVPTLQASAS